MPAKYRITRRDFLRMRGFRRLSGTFFSLSYGYLPGRTSPGGACVVSAKTLPRAAGRNLLKRRCRAALLPLLRQAPDPIVLIWHAKRPAAGASGSDIRAEIRTLARAAGLSAA